MDLTLNSNGKLGISVCYLLDVAKKEWLDFHLSHKLATTSVRQFSHTVIKELRLRSLDEIKIVTVHYIMHMCTVCEPCPWSQ